MCCSKGHCLHKPWKVLENFSISLKRPWNDKNVRHCSHLSGELSKWKCSLSKTLSKPEELKTPSFRWDVDQERFENASFRKRWRHNNHVIYPNPQGGTQEFCRPAIVAFSKFSGPVWTVIHFHIETPLSDFSGVVCKGGIRHFHLKLTPDNAFGIFMPKPAKRLRLAFLHFPISKKCSDIRSVTSFRWKSWLDEAFCWLIARVRWASRQGIRC